MLDENGYTPLAYDDALDIAQGTVPTVDDLDELAQSCSIRLGICLGHRKPHFY